MLTKRDLDVLRAAERHRFIRTDHFQALFFHGERAAQSRLRQLWEHGYLERLYLASVQDGRRRPPRGTGVPIYTLGSEGEQVLKTSKDPVQRAPETPSPAHIAHHLVVTDFLVALEVAARKIGGLRITEGAHEWDLWKSVGTRDVPTKGRRIVPDGAVTLARVGFPTPETYHLEVVRASVSGGNATLWDKMLRYAEMNHRGAFRELYGHERVRAILIATTSEARAETLRALAASLPHGRKLFAFASYEQPGEDGRAEPRFTPERILELRWKTLDGDVFRLGDAPVATTEG